MRKNSIFFMVSNKSRDGIKSAGFVFMAKARTRGRITMVKKEEGGEEKKMDAIIALNVSCQRQP